MTTDKTDLDIPVNKLLYYGINSLTDSELLAVVISPTVSSMKSLDKAKQLLKTCNNRLTDVAKLSIKQLKDLGLTQQQCISLVAASYFFRRRLQEYDEKKQITKSSQVFDIFFGLIGDMDVEIFIVMYLNRANRIITTETISLGGITGTVVDPKVIFKKALIHNATSIILGHNHPSGQIHPSEADIELTKKIKRVGENMDIPVLDHIIVGDNKYYSFADESAL